MLFANLQGIWIHSVSPWKKDLQPEPWREAAGSQWLFIPQNKRFTPFFKSNTSSIINFCLDTVLPCLSRQKHSWAAVSPQPPNVAGMTGLVSCPKCQESVSHLHTWFLTQLMHWIDCMWQKQNLQKPKHAAILPSCLTMSHLCHCQNHDFDNQEALPWDGHWPQLTLLPFSCSHQCASEGEASPHLFMCPFHLHHETGHLSLTCAL